MTDIIKYRQDLHQIPELGFNEYKTQEYILNIIKNYNCRIKIIKTGILCFFDNNANKTIGFRTDMDALMIEEKNDIPFKSIHKGIMHACGHDGHMAMMLSLAGYLNEHYKEYDKNFLLIFQPSEEENCGAKTILATNFIKKYNVKALFGFHVWPNLEAGQIYTRSNELMAKSAEVNIEIIGHAAHVANEDKGIDSLLVASKYLLDIYDKEHAYDEKIYRLLKCGKLESGTARNIISGKTKMYITLRAYQNDVYESLKKMLFDEAKKYEAEYKVKFVIDINEGYEAVINDEKLVKKVETHVLTKGYKLNILNKPVLQAEDFGCYTKYVPAVFFFLGLGKTEALHTDHFDFDSSLLENGLNFYKMLLDLEI